MIQQQITSVVGAPSTQAANGTTSSSTSTPNTLFYESAPPPNVAAAQPAQIDYLLGDVTAKKDLYSSRSAGVKRKQVGADEAAASERSDDEGDDENEDEDDEGISEDEVKITLKNAI